MPPTTFNGRHARALTRLIAAGDAAGIRGLAAPEAPAAQPTEAPPEAAAWIEELAVSLDDVDRPRSAGGIYPSPLMLLLWTDETFNIMRARVNLPAAQFCETFAALLERAQAALPWDPREAPRPRPLYSVFHCPAQGANDEVSVLCTTEDLFKSTLAFLHERHHADSALRRRVLEMLLDAGYAPDRSGIMWIMRHGGWFAAQPPLAAGSQEADANSSALCGRIVGSAPACVRVETVAWLINYHFYASEAEAPVLLRNAKALRLPLLFGNMDRPSAVTEYRAFGALLARERLRVFDDNRMWHDVFKTWFDPFVRTRFGRLPIDYARHPSTRAALDARMRERERALRPRVHALLMCRTPRIVNDPALRARCHLARLPSELFASILGTAFTHFGWRPPPLVVEAWLPSRPGIPRDPRGATRRSSTGAAAARAEDAARQEDDAAPAEYVDDPDAL